MNNNDLESIEKIIYKIRTGSNLYGTMTEKSDDDFLGVFIPKKDYILGLKTVEQVILSEKVTKTLRNSKGDIDYTSYSIKKFLNLALGNNPNIIEMLFVPNQFILEKTREMDLILKNKDKIISRECYWKFKAYAHSQLQKLQVKKENMTGRKELASEFGYDVKFASHVLRLLLECLELLLEGKITFPLKNNNLIRDIKIGKYPLHKLLELSEYYEKLCDSAYIESQLPKTSDFNYVNTLLIDILTLGIKND